MLPGSRSFLCCPRAIPPGRNPNAPPSPVVFISEKPCSTYAALPWPNRLKILAYPDLNLLCFPPPLKYFFPSCSPPLAPPSSTPFLLSPQLPEFPSLSRLPQRPQLLPFHLVTKELKGLLCLSHLQQTRFFRDTHSPECCCHAPSTLDPP